MHHDKLVCRWMIKDGGADIFPGFWIDAALNRVHNRFAAERLDARQKFGQIVRSNDGVVPQNFARRIRTIAAEEPQAAGRFDGAAIESSAINYGSNGVTQRRAVDVNIDQ